MAVLSEDDVDVTTLDAATAAVGPDGAGEVHGMGHPEDVDDDGDVDLVLLCEGRAARYLRRSRASTPFLERRPS